MNDLKTVRDALELCRFALEPYNDIKPRDWSTDRQNLRFAHEDAVKALATLDRMIETLAQQGLPSEPTEEIINAIHDVISGDIEGYDGQQMDWYAKIYKAMLSAAPTPAPTERVERIEGLEEAINATITTPKQHLAIIKAAVAYLKLQSGDTENVDVEKLRYEVVKNCKLVAYEIDGANKAVDYLSNTGRLR